MRTAAWILLTAAAVLVLPRVVVADDRPEAMSPRPRDALQAPRQSRRRHLGGRDSGRRPEPLKALLKAADKKGDKRSHAGGVPGGGERASLAAPAAVWATAVWATAVWQVR